MRPDLAHKYARHTCVVDDPKFPLREHADDHHVVVVETALAGLTLAPRHSDVVRWGGGGGGGGGDSFVDQWL